MILSWIEIRNSMMMALSSIRSNKFRAFLTVLGVMVGVSSVIALASVINGLSGAVEAEIDSMGSNTLFIDRFPVGVEWDKLTEEERNRPFLTAVEAEAIVENCPSVDAVSPQNHWWEPGGNEIKYKNRKTTNNPAVVGAWPDYMKVNNASLTSGRFLSFVDENSRAHLCVIGNDLANYLFEQEEPVGKAIRVNGDKFFVIGVFEKIESNFDNNEINNLVVFPLSTYQKIYPQDEALTLLAKSTSYQTLDQAIEEIIATLRIVRKVPFNKDNNFAVFTQETIKESAAEIINYVYMAMIIITSVGLMVGGIGVMNIMLVSVTERTREIGVRKAIGAKKINIIMQFLTEAMTLSGAGGVIGIIFGVIVGMILNSLFSFPMTLSIFWIVLGFMVSVSVGLVSGIYPAFKASRLDPIESLRYE